MVKYLHETRCISVEANISYINLKAFLKALPCLTSLRYRSGIFFFVFAVVPGEGVRQSGSHKCGDRMELGVQGKTGP